MKKTLLIAAAMVATMTAGAQTFVTTTTSYRFGVIPASLTADGQGRILINADGSEFGVSQWEIRNAQLQVETTLNLDFHEYTYVDRLERRLEDGSWEEVGNGSWGHPANCYLSYHNLEDGILDAEEEFFVTQTLFNTNSDYEYLVPEASGTYSYEYDGENWYGEETGHYRQTYSMCQTISIKTTNGSTVGSISAPSGYSFDNGDGFYARIFRMGSNLYIVFNVSSTTQDEGAYAWYRIDHQSQSITLVETTPMSVRPTVANRGQEITVELGDGAQATELEVVNTLGQTVKRVPVQPGQREVRINTADLGHGMNIINSRKQGAVKIIVK